MSVGQVPPTRGGARACAPHTGRGASNHGRCMRSTHTGRWFLQSGAARALHAHRERFLQPRVARGACGPSLPWLEVLTTRGGACAYATPHLKRCFRPRAVHALHAAHGEKFLQLGDCVCAPRHTAWRWEGHGRRGGRGKEAPRHHALLREAIIRLHD